MVVYRVESSVNNQIGLKIGQKTTKKGGKMKKNIIVVMAFVAMVCCVSSSVSARECYRGDYPRHQYREQPRYEEHRHHRGNDGAEFLAGAIVGGVLGVIVAPQYYAPPPPPPPQYYDPEPVVRYRQQPRICVEERIVYGEWQQCRRGQVWVEYAYPRRVPIQVPCY